MSTTFINPIEQVLSKLDGVKPTGKPAQKKTHLEKRIVAIYDYTDESGELLYQVVRYDPKDFRQRRSDGNGGYIWNLNNVLRVPYRYLELLASNVEGYVYITEGEGKCDDLREHFRQTATTFSGGSNGWRPEYAKYFKGRCVAILTDNDTPGRNFGQAVAAGLYLEAKDVRIVDLPGLPGKGDVSDFIDAGGTLEKLWEHVENAPPFGPLDVKAEPFVSADKPDEKIEKFPLTDSGNGERFVSFCGDKIRYCWSWKKWLFFDGCRWNTERGRAMAVTLAVKTARQMLVDASKISSPRSRGALVDHARKSESRMRVSAMIELAKSWAPVESYATQFDQDIMALNLQNGTLDLHDGKLKKHDPANNITKRANVNFDKRAACPLWLDCLNTWMDSDQEKISYLQTLSGILLTGDVTARIFPIFYGVGRNGKSVFCNTLLELLGNYASIAPEKFLDQRHENEHPTELAKLFGLRYVLAKETRNRMKLRTELIKTLSGDTRLTGRFMRGDYFDFSITNKVVLMTNEKPMIDDSTSAIWDRLHLCEWPVRIAEDKQDTRLTEKLQQEFSGILNWCVAGCLAWQKDGRLIPPESIRQTTQEYEHEQNPLADFLDECTISGDDGLAITVRDLRKRYDQWAVENSIKYTLSPINFNARLRAMGFVDKQIRLGGKNQKCWHGLCLTL